MPLVGAIALVGCQDSGVPKQLKPVPSSLVAAMARLDMAETSEIFVRIYKESSEFEIWKQKRNGDFALLKTYEICKWSGKLGPKKLEGDRQAPEGVYTITPGQMNPNSNYYLSFNMGYPNAYDRSLGRTGSNLMVHGACSSAGCYSMTDEAAGEIFALARDSFRGGQRSFQVQALPFRMTPENLARHYDDPNMSFWQMLKEASDSFELTRKPPKVDVCAKHYVFNADAGTARFDPSASCPPYTQPDWLEAALAKKKAADDAATQAKLAELKAAANAADEEKAAAEAKAAADAERAAERASRPSLMTRLLDKVSGKDASTIETPVETAPQKVSAAAPAPAPTPTLSPTRETSSTATASIAPAETPLPAGATKVKKKLLWWGDEAGDPATQ